MIKYKKDKFNINKFEQKLLKEINPIILFDNNNYNDIKNIIEKLDNDKDILLNCINKLIRKNNNLEIKNIYDFDYFNNIKFNILIDDTLYGAIDITNQGHKWNNIERKQLIEEIKNNLNLYQIAINHKRSIECIKKKIYKMADNMLNENIPIENICNIFKLEQLNDENEIIPTLTNLYNNIKIILIKLNNLINI